MTGEELVESGGGAGWEDRGKNMRMMRRGGHGEGKREGRTAAAGEGARYFGSQASFQVASSR
eukprot:8669610-Pyramimonas_sp.AAC.1